MNRPDLRRLPSLTRALALAGLVALTPASAAAQPSSAPAAPGAGPTDPTTVPASPPPAAVAVPASEVDPNAAAASAVPPAAVDPRVGELERRIAELEAARRAEAARVAATEAAAVAEPRGRVRVTGYVQGRYEWREEANYGLDPQTRTPRGTTRFLVRRARLKTRYEAPGMELMVQFGSTGAEARLVDAEASFVDIWTPFHFKLTVGQFLVPFGFEIPLSSAEREMPERALGLRTLFPGERDRGVRLQARYGVVTFVGALINGNGIQDPLYGLFDQTSWKDLVGRLGFTLPRLSGGVSGYFGHALRTQVPSEPARQPTYDRFDRLRIGADLQLSMIGVPAAGPFILRGEVVWSDDRNIAFSGNAPDSCKDIESIAWYVTLVQSLGERAAIFGRVDDFNPRRGLAPRCPAHAGSRVDRTTTVGGGLQIFLVPQLRASAVYEHLMDEGPNRGNDVFTAQLQARF